MDILLAEDLGRAVRDRRKTLGLSQAAFAKQVGVTQPWLSNLERGKDGAAFGTVCRVLAHLDLKLVVTEKSARMVQTIDADQSHKPRSTRLETSTGWMDPETRQRHQKLLSKVRRHD